MNTNSTEKLSYEQAITRLEEIVKQMEQGNAPLEESLKLFEEGTALIAQCAKQLDEAELKVVRLMKGPDGNPIEKELENDDAAN